MSPPVEQLRSVVAEACIQLLRSPEGKALIRDVFPEDDSTPRGI